MAQRPSPSRQIAAIVLPPSFGLCRWRSAFVRFNGERLTFCPTRFPQPNTSRLAHTPSATTPASRRTRRSVRCDAAAPTCRRGWAGSRPPAPSLPPAALVRAGVEVRVAGEWELLGVVGQRGERAVADGAPGRQFAPHEVSLAEGAGGRAGEQELLADVFLASMPAQGAVHGLPASSGTTQGNCSPQPRQHPSTTGTGFPSWLLQYTTAAPALSAAATSSVHTVS